MNLPELQDVHYANADENEAPLPLVVCNERVQDPRSWFRENSDHILDIVHTVGGVLFRGFKMAGPGDFERIAEILSKELLGYKERSSPRTHVGGKVYTSTEHPRNQEIFLHNEQSYNLTFPSKIFFYCAEPAASGGFTPLADSRKVYQRLVHAIPDCLRSRGYLLTRNYRPLLGVDWKYVFQTESKADVEEYCEDKGIQVTWTGRDTLRTTQVRECVARHPVTGVPTWFNHCTFFNVNCLAAQIRDVLLTSYGEDELPNNTFYHDGGEIPVDVVDLMKSSYEEEKRYFDWQKGDLLFLDNMLTSHGRSSFQGDRRVFTVMSDIRSWGDVSLLDRPGASELV